MAMIDIDWNPGTTMLRRFSAVGAAFFGGLAAWAALKGWSPGWLPWTAGGLALFCALCAWIAPKWNLPLYLALTVLTFPIGLVISYLVLGFIYFGLMTPLGLVFRLMGRDALTRRLDPQAETYWVPRESVGDLRRYFRQF